MSKALTSMLGRNSTGFVSADDLPDSYDSDITQAYKVMRKKTVCSLYDMSEMKIGYFDAVPDGYIERPAHDSEHRRMRIFLPEKKFFGTWVSGYDVPAGWKTKDQLTPDEWDMMRQAMGWESIETMRERGLRFRREFRYMYDPATLECRMCRTDDPPCRMGGRKDHDGGGNAESRGRYGGKRSQTVFRS